VAPAHQRLHAGDAVRGEGDDRLVLDGEPPVLERLAEIGFELHPFHGRLVHGGLEDLVPPRAPPLGGVHGDVSVAEELPAVDARAVEGDADRGPDEHLPPGEAERSLQNPDDPVGQLGRVADGFQVLE
jgi:hypothetical protein